MTTADEVRDRIRMLADELAASGALRNPEWRTAFERVPRHLFVPRFYEQAQNDTNAWTAVDGTDPARRGAWLDAVYSDDVLITQVTETTAPAEFGGQVHTRATSSASMPGLMLDMLESLDVADGHRVLEIGTGTGYNAALLSARLGGDRVTSVDIHPDLIDAARERLAGLGHHPTLATVDGSEGFPRRALYDRIVATCSVPSIPTAWITQLAPSGILVGDLRRNIGGGLVKAHKTGPDTLEGGFLPSPAEFMRLRPAADSPLHAGETLGFALDTRDTRGTTTRVDPNLLENPDFALLLQLHLPNVRLYPPTDDAYLLFADEDEWARVDTHPTTPGTYAITYAGDGDLWNTVEHAYETWQRAGHPTRERYRLTASPGGQRVRLDPPHGPSWEIPSGLVARP